MSKNKQPTIIDVAKEAGVSIATVSNVLNKRKVPLTRDTIRRVEQAVQRLGYRRNVMAANLSSRRTYELGLIIPSFEGYYGRFAETLELKVHRYGYHLSIFSTGGLNPDMERRHLELLLQRRVDGLVCHGLAMSHESTRRIVGTGTPLVIFNGWGWPADIAPIAVNLNFAGAAEEAVRHFVMRGCESVFYVGSRQSVGANRQREEGFKEGVLRYAEGRVNGLLDVGDLGVSGVIERILKLSGERLPIGILSYNDALALKLLTECQTRGIRVPETVKLIGIDNELYSQASYPAISTFDMPVDRQTGLISGWLLKQLGEEMESGTLPVDSPVVELTMPLIPRRSTDANA